MRRPQPPIAPDEREGLEALVERELWRPVPPLVEKLAQALVSRPAGARIRAILFYGSTLRSESPVDGIVDLYCLVDDLRGFYATRRTLAWAGIAVPPNVFFEVVHAPEGTVRAKVAVMSLRQFRWASRHGLGMSVWARFCQPTVLCYARDADASATVRGAVADAVVTALRWACRLRAEPSVSRRQLWIDLFRFTYRTELRAEREERAALIYDHHAPRYDEIVEPALRAAGIEYDLSGDHVRPRLPVLRGNGLRRAAWTSVGKTLSVLRLVKAAFTFADGVDYLCWKIERHSGTRIAVSPWQRRHPILAGPLVLWRLWRRGIIR